jgi:hypothetical protein
MRRDFRRHFTLVPVIGLQRVQGVSQIVVETVPFTRAQRILENVEMIKERVRGMQLDGDRGRMDLSGKRLELASANSTG